MKHLKKCSSADPDDRPKQTCEICGRKDLVFIELHMRQLHGANLQISKMCPVCKITVEGDVKLFNKHKRECRKCPFCGYENAQNKRDRLLKHIDKCPKREQETALDLRSPLKKPADLRDHIDPAVVDSKEASFENSPQVSSDSGCEGQEEMERIMVDPRLEATFGVGDGIGLKVGSAGHVEQDRVQVGLQVGQPIVSEVIFFCINTTL